MKKVDLEELKTKYPFIRDPNLSRVTSRGVYAETVVDEILKEGKAKKVFLVKPSQYSGHYYHRALNYFPKYDVYLTEGGAPLAPVAIKKILHRKSINIEIIADETFMMKETPEVMNNRKWTL